MVIGSGHDTDRDSYSAVFPSTSWTYVPASSVGHRQVILRPEIRRVGLVRGGRDRVRDSSATAPAQPDVSNTCATALGRSRGNSVA